MNRCRNIVPVVAAVVALMLAVAACGHGGMTEQAARAAVDTVEAHYKAYATTEADLPLIDEADRRLDRRGVDRRTRVRAALYHGAVLDELGRPDSALLHYKRAEATCDTADHDLLGYVNLRIASLYKNNFVGNSATLNKYKKALNHFERTDSIHYQIICLQNIGGVYRKLDMPLAYSYLKRALQLATKMVDSVNVCYTNELLARALYYDSKYLEAKEIGLKCLNNYNNFCSKSIYFDIIRSYIKLNQIDSAQYYLGLIDTLALEPSEIILKELSCAEIASFIGSNSGYLFHKTIADSISKSIEYNVKQISLDSICTSVDNSLLNNEITKRRSLTTLAIVAIIICVLLSFVFYRILINKKKELYDIIRGIKSTEEKTKRELDQISSQDLCLKKLISEHIALLGDILDDSSCRPKNVFAKNTITKINQLYNDRKYIDSLYSFVDNHYGNAISKITHGKVISQNEMDIIILTACGFTSSEIALCLGISSASSVRVKRKRLTDKLGINIPLEQYLNIEKSLFDK